MKKRSLFIALAGVFTAIVIWFTFFPKTASQTEKIISLIPEQSFGTVYLPSSAWLDSIQSSSAWSGVAENSYFNNLSTNINSAKHWAEKLNLQQQAFYLSAHTLPGQGLEWVVYVPLSENSPLLDKATDFSSLLSMLPGYNLYKRSYKDKTIYEIGRNEEGLKFTFILTDQVLVGSFSGILIEDVVRASFNTKTHYVYRLRATLPASEIDGDLPAVFINFEQLPQLSDCLGFSDELKRYSSFFLSQCGLLKWEKNAGKWIFELPLLMAPDEAKQSVPGVLHKLPVSTSLAIQISQEGMAASFYTQVQHPEFATRHLGDAMAQVFLESRRMRKYEKVAIYAVREHKHLLAVMDSLEQLNAKADSSAYRYQQNVMGIEIKKLKKQYWPLTAISSAKEDLNSPVFFAFHDQRMYVSEDPESIKIYIQELFNKEQPGAQFEGGLHGYGALLYVNLERSLPLMFENTKPPIRDWLQNNYDWLKSWNSITLAADKGKTNLLKVTTGARDKEALQALAPDKAFNVDTTLLADLHLITHPATGEDLICAQDIKTQFYLFQPDGKAIFTKKMGAALLQAPIALLWDGKPALALGVPHGVFIVNFAGQSLTSSPYRLPDSLQNIRSFNVIDPAQDNKHLIAITSKYGDVFLLDKQKNALPGWNPLVTGRALVSKPIYVQVHGLDYFISTTTDGTVLATDKQGNTHHGFPLRMSRQVSSTPLYYAGYSLTNSYIYLMDDLGEMVKFNLMGEVVSRFQLFRPDKNTRFYFVPDAAQQNFIVGRQHDNNITIFDQSYKALFELNVPKEGVRLQFHNFGTSKRWIVVRNSVDKTANIYTETGKLINKTPINTDTDVLMRYDATSAKYQLWCSSGKKLMTYTMKAN